MRQGDPAQLTPGTNPFTCGGVAPFGVVPDDPGNPPPPANADILTGVQPQSLTRGHPMTLTLQFDAVSWPYKDVVLQYQVAGAWTTQSIHHNAWDSASHDVFCSTSTTTCTADASFTVVSTLVSRFSRCKTGLASAGIVLVSWRT